MPCCVECGDAIDEDTKALQCESCVEDVWKCTGCLGLSDELYEQLATETKCNLHWFCDKCESMVVSASVLHDKVKTLVESKIDGIDSYLRKALSDMEQKMLSKIDHVEQVLQKKADNELLVSIEGRVKKIENHPATLEESQNRIEFKVDQLRGNNVEPVVTAVHDVLQQDKAEETEIERRKKNVIVHGVPESDSTEPGQRVDDDLALLSVMFHEADVQNLTVDSVVRLGKKSSDQASNPRPMKVVLNSVEGKSELLKKAKNLRVKEEGGWNRVFIHQDLTPKQREARKPLVAELKERKAKGEMDLIIFNGKVIKRRGTASQNQN